jgi:hypothetical protein
MHSNTTPTKATEDDERTEPDVFSLISMIDSSAAQRAAERLYASGLSGLRFFSESNRAVPRARIANGTQPAGQVACADDAIDTSQTTVWPSTTTV